MSEAKKQPNGIKVLVRPEVQKRDNKEPGSFVNCLETLGMTEKLAYLNPARPPHPNIIKAYASVDAMTLKVLV